MGGRGWAGRALGALLATLVACAPSLARPDALPDVPLAVTLSAGAEPGEVFVRVVNTGAVPLAVLPAGTPLEPALSADVFRITRAAKRWPPLERAAYRGRRVKRVVPAAADFVTLGPGQDITARVALARHYEIPEADDYRVALDGRIAVADPVALARAAAGSRVPLHRHLPLRTTGALVPLAPDDGERRARPAAFAGCDGRHRAALTETTAAAERLVVDALGELDRHAGPALASAPRHTHWFGPWAPARADRVRGVFAALLDSLSGATLAYDCGCTDPTLYAYVYPTRLHDVFVCPAFFRAPLLGRDSRAGTLVHELTHFEAVGGTADHGYGAEDVAALARRDPALAVANADSYEYFAENAPPRPMTGGVASIDATVPPDDAPPLAVTSLPLDTVVTGTLGAGRTERFTARDAGVITVDSLAGDADLYLFGDADLAALTCASTTLERSGATEVCPVRTKGAVHVIVHAYTDTRYAIRATSATTSTPATPAASPTVDVRDDAGDGSSRLSGGGAGDGPGGGGAPGLPLLPAMAVCLVVRSVRERRERAPEPRCAANRYTRHEGRERR